MRGRSGPFWDGLEGRAPVPGRRWEPDQSRSTLQLNVRCLWPVRPGRVISGGRIVHRDGTWVPGGGTLRRRWGGHRHRDRPG